MGLVTLKEILAGTREGHYAVGGFNFNSYEDAQGIIEGAAAKNSPVILMASMGAVQYIGLHQVACMLAVQRAVLAEEVVAEKVIKYVFTENTGYHNQCLQFVLKSLCRCSSLLRRAQA